jgi:chorismate mutase
MDDPARDPFVRQLREQISDNDRALVAAINKRLDLVARLKAYKDSRGYDFVDTAREEHMLQDLQRANRGPLSTAGLSALYAEVLALTKREVAEEDA